MISKERKFLKLVDLYTQVIESGSTWGVQNDEDIIINTQAGKRRNHRWNRFNKYISRHSAHLDTLNKGTDVLSELGNYLGSDEFAAELSEVDLAYPIVRTGNPIKEPDKGMFYW